MNNISACIASFLIPSEANQFSGIDLISSLQIELNLMGL